MARDDNHNENHNDDRGQNNLNQQSSSSHRPQGGNGQTQPLQPHGNNDAMKSDNNADTHAGQPKPSGSNPQPHGGFASALGNAQNKMENGRQAMNNVGHRANQFAHIGDDDITNHRKNDMDPQNPYDSLGSTDPLKNGPQGSSFDENPFKTGKPQSGGMNTDPANNSVGQKNPKSNTKMGQGHLGKGAMGLAKGADKLKDKLSGAGGGMEGADEAQSPDTDPENNTDAQNDKTGKGALGALTGDDKVGAGKDGKKGQDDKAKQQNDDKQSDNKQQNSNNQQQDPNRKMGNPADNQTKQTSGQGAIGGKQNGKDKAGQGLKNAGKGLAKKAGKEGAKAGGAAAGGMEAMGMAKQGIFMLLKNLMGQIGGAAQGAMHLGASLMHGAASLVKGAFGALHGMISGVASTVMGASMASTVGTVGASSIMSVLPIGLLAAGAVAISPALEFHDGTGCVTSDELSANTYQSNFKVMPIVPPGLTGADKAQATYVSESIEKWGIKNHLNAAQVAGILGNALQESTMGTNPKPYTGMNNALGAGAYTGDHSHDQDSADKYLYWFSHTFSSDGYDHSGLKYNHGDGFSHAPDAWLWYKNHLIKSSPWECGYFWGHYLDVDGAHTDEQRGKNAERFYKQLTKGGGGSVIMNAIDNSSIGKWARSVVCGQKKAPNVGDASDGTGSIKEMPHGSYIMWLPKDVPTDVQPFIHDPRKVYMGYQNSRNWYNSGGQCVMFASSYFRRIWRIRGQPMVMYGRQEVQDWSKSATGKISHTPHTGDIASCEGSVVPLTGGNSAGHTWIVQHVLKNGDTIIAQQNWPDKSGDDAGMPNTWNFGVLSHQLLQKYSSQITYFSPDKNKYKLQWTE